MNVRLAVPYVFLALVSSLASAQTPSTPQNGSPKKSDPVKVPPRGPNTPLNVAQAAKPCLPGNSHDYGNPNVCLIEIDRQVPVSPLPLRVSKHTAVQVRVRRRSNLEVISFVPTSTTLPNLDLGASLFSSLSGILPGFVSLKSRSSTYSPPFGAYAEIIRIDTVPDRQNKIAKALADRKSALDKASKDLSALKAHESAEEKSKIADPAQQQKQDVDFNRQVQQFLTDTDPNRLVNGLPTPSLDTIGGDLKGIDDELAVRLIGCRRLKTVVDCEEDTVRLQQNNATLTTALNKIRQADDALAVSRDAIAALPLAGDYIYQIKSDPNVNSVVKISAKDALNGTSTDLATVSISWQTTSYSVSAGLMVSTMPGRTFANGAEIVNGAPSGTIKVTETDSKPSWVTPLALLNYEVAAFGNAQWGFLISAGAGSNLTTKTADFAVGPSLRFRDLILTPALHYGKETILTNGVFVGDTNLGSGITAPTGTEYRPHFGMAITYRIRLP